MAFTQTFAFPGRVWVVTKLTPPGATRALQGHAIAAGVTPDGKTSYLVTDQHGGIAPVWVGQDDVIRCEVRKDGA